MNPGQNPLLYYSALSLAAVAVTVEPLALDGKAQASDGIEPEDLPCC